MCARAGYDSGDAGDVKTSNIVRRNANDYCFIDLDARSVLVTACLQSLHRACSIVPAVAIVLCLQLVPAVADSAVQCSTR